MSTDKPLITASELLQMGDDGCRYDLLRGELIQMPLLTRKQSRIVVNFLHALNGFVVENQLGEVYGPEVGYLLETKPDTVLAPDISFVDREHLADIANVDGYIPLAPNLIVEVNDSPYNFHRIDERIQVWLDTGTKAAIVLQPPKFSAWVFRPRPRMLSYTQWLSSDESRFFPANDCAALQICSSEHSLQLPDIVPGWTVPLKLIFD